MGAIAVTHVGVDEVELVASVLSLPEGDERWLVDPLEEEEFTVVRHCLEPATAHKETENLFMAMANALLAVRTSLDTGN